MTGGIGTRSVDVAIVGGGIAGLACARVLHDAGRAHRVFERSRGIGGRCATRRISGQPVDHGAAFIHGSDEGFLAAVHAVGGSTILDGWPHVIEGVGPPCLPKAFDPFEMRLAYDTGMTAFPKHLARQLEIQRETPVKGISAASGGILTNTEAGDSIWSPSVVLAVPAPTALALLAPLAGEGTEAAAILALLRMIGSQSCLTAIAGYPAEADLPSWDICYPDDSAIVQMISHDSAKRTVPRFVVLVVQARPCWSLINLGEREETWAAALVREAARIVGAWAGRPSWVQAHRWRFARSDRGSELSRPLSMRVGGGGRVIVTGEAFASGGGIEAAWCAGTAGARRLLEEE